MPSGVPSGKKMRIENGRDFVGIIRSTCSLNNETQFGLMCLGEPVLEVSP
jgi:hypothetical protein